MKHLIRILCLAALAAGSNLSAQTPTSDDFLTGTPSDRWEAISNATMPKGNASTTIAGGQMTYVVTTPTAKDAAGRLWTPSVGSTLSNWVVQIEVSLSSPTLTDGQYINLQIGASSGNHSFLNSIDQYQDGLNTVSQFEAYNDSSSIGTYARSLSSATLRLGYSTDAGGTLAAGFYDSGYASNDGLGTGYRVYASSTGILTSWSLGSSDTFNIILIGGSGLDAGTGPVIADGIASFDNFSSTGLDARAVPEPSTYTAIIGLLALGFAIYRRR